MKKIIYLLFLVLLISITFVGPASAVILISPQEVLSEIVSVTKTPANILLGDTVTITMVTKGTPVYDSIFVSLILKPTGLITGAQSVPITLKRVTSTNYVGSTVIANFGMTGALCEIESIRFMNGSRTYASINYQFLKDINNKLSFTAINPADPSLYVVAAPTITSPSATTLKLADISVNWSAVSNATNYIVSLYDDTNKTTVSLTTSETTSTTLTIPSAKFIASHIYKIGVVAKNSNVTSNQTIVTITIAAAAPVVVTPVVITPVTVTPTVVPVVVTAPVVTTPTGLFSDLASNHWAYTSISNLVKKGYIKGYPDGTFKPKNNITRAEFITILMKSLANKATSTSTGFKDVSSTHWAAKEIAVAKTAKITDGYLDGTFKPSGNITRAEIVSMVNNAKKLPVGKIVVKLNDINKHWAKQAIISAASNGIVSGYKDSTFKPNNFATRAEASVIIDAMLKK